MTAGAPRAAVVSVGNELLFGQTIDTNAAWLGRELTSIGIPVVRRFTVRDRSSEITEALRAAMDAARLVIVSGGLGPTPDDLTKSTVAAALGLDLVVDPGVRDSLHRRYAAAGVDPVPATSLQQAEIPAGATALRNPEGTAPGILIEHHACWIVLLPGVPRELRAIVEGDLLPYLERLLPSTKERIWHHVVHTTGVAESELSTLLEDALAAVPAAERSGVDLAYLPDLLGVDLRFSATGTTLDDAMDRMAPLLAAAAEIVAPYRFDSDSGDLAGAVSDLLREGGMTLATAESCTGGLIAKRLTDLAGSSDVFVGGIVAYANDVKVRQVGVSAVDLEAHGAVSGPVAEQLAMGVAARLGADVGIGVTGVAGPGGGSEQKPVGTVWIGTAVRGVVQARAGRFAGGRDAVRARAAQAALAAVYRRLREDGEG